MRTASFFLAALFSLASLVSLVSLGGCSSSDFDVAGGDGGTDSTLGDGASDTLDDTSGCTGSSCPCTDPLFRCGTKCVDRSTDPEHCGACADRCPAPPGGAPTCNKGICGFGCAAGMHACGSVCVSDSSPGSCGTSCAPCPGGTNASPSCSGGKCGLACHAGFADCNGGTDGCETDINTTANCGGCGKPCAAGFVCAPDGAGGFGCTDTCTSPNLLCGPACIDPRDDPAHCGGCDTVCASDDHGTPLCGGTPPACGVTCDSGFHACAGRCTSDADKNACGTACIKCSDPHNASGFCDATTGTCKFDCNSGFADCDGDPTTGCEIDLANDPSHCGSCLDACPAPSGGSATCSGGTCGGKCDPGWALLGGVCAVFGGAYEQNFGATSCADCAVPDFLGTSSGTPGCACPSGFVGETVSLAMANVCGGTSPSATSPITFCFAPPGTGGAPPDLSGVFLQASGCGGGCPTPNPFTGACTCPAGTSEKKITVRTCGSALADGTLGICQGPASGPTFFGAYVTDSAGGCIDGSGCTCAGGKTKASYPILTGGASPSHATLVLCEP